jgi:hypothetical protein
MGGLLIAVALCHRPCEVFGLPIAGNRAVAGDHSMRQGWAPAVMASGFVLPRLTINLFNAAI